MHNDFYRGRGRIVIAMIAPEGDIFDCCYSSLSPFMLNIHVGEVGKSLVREVKLPIHVVASAVS